MNIGRDMSLGVWLPRGIWVITRRAITGIYFDFDQRNDRREANPQADISTNISCIELQLKG
jgi:hypothetical protein